MKTTLKDQLDAMIADSESQGEETYEGGDCWQLTEAEEEVFKINRRRFPRMYCVYYCYEAFKRMNDSEEWDSGLISQARADHPEWCRAEMDVIEFALFAKEYGRLTNREAYAMFFKNEFWEVRAGVAHYGDEA